MQDRGRSPDRGPIKPELKMLMDACPVGTLVFDQGERLLYANRHAEELFGKKLTVPGEAKCGDFIGCANRNRDPRGCGHTSLCPTCPLSQSIRLALSADGEAQEGEAFLSRETGYDPIWVKYKVGGIRLIGDACAVMAVDDITDRKKAREALGKSEDRFRQIFEGAPLGYQSLDEDARLINVNEAWLELLGYSRSEVIERSFGDFLAQQEMESFEERYAVLKESGEVHADVEMVQKGGFRIVVRIDGKVGYDEYGRFRQMHCILHDITQRKEADEALRQSEERFRRLAEATFEGIAIHEGGVLITANEQYFKLFEYEPHELLGNQVVSLTVAPEAREPMIEQIVTGGRGPYESIGLTKNGRTFPMEIRVRETKIGERTLRVGAIRDITERKQAEQALRESGEAHRSILQTTMEGFWLVDLQGRLKEVNDAYCRMSGYSEEELLAMSISDLEVCESCPDIASHIQKMITQGGDRFQSKHRRKDGHIFDVEISTGYQATEGGCIFAFLRDITEQKRAREELEESEKRYRNLFENLYDIYYRADVNGIITLISPSVERYTGYKPNELLGRTITDFYVNPGLGEDFLRDLLRDGYVNNFESQLRRKDGSPIWVSVNGRMLEDDNRDFAGVEGIARDITQLKQMQMDRKRLQSQLQQAQKMEVIGTFAGGIAHDFNNILSPILVYAEMAMMDLPPDSPLQHNMKQIYRAGERARELVRQILGFAKQQAKERVPIRISPIVREGIGLLRAAIPATIDIQSDIDALQDIVLADPTQVNQILMNLCTNAAHAMEEKGGVLDLRLATEYVGAEEAKGLPDLTPGSYLRLTVRDTGHGIAPDITGKIFDPYFTTKPVGKGTGMGLALVHGIVKSHGGGVTFDSEIGKGTTFRVYLPLVEGDLAVVEKAKGSGGLPTGTERILVVDDERAAVDAVQAMLERLGYKVTARTSSIEALEAFKHKPDAYDLVITDQTMPNMTGRELAGELMRIRPGIPIIICTGFSEQIDEASAKEMGIGAFVMKPIILRQIAATIREVLYR